MRPDFQRAFVEQFPRLPAEACSELGYVNERRASPPWLTRWLAATCRWLRGGRAG